MKSFHSEWNDYRRKCVHPAANQIQIEETRKAFYAGAMSFFVLVGEMLTPGNRTTMQDLVNLAKLHDELFVEFPMTLQSQTNERNQA